MNQQFQEQPILAPIRRFVYYSVVLYTYSFDLKNLNLTHVQ
jgi:hypothetical protein